jgi:hypothetical protein
MPKRSRTKKTAKPRRPAEVDPNVARFNAVPQIIASGEASGKDPLAVALGRLGGLKGGKARAEKLTREKGVKARCALLTLVGTNEQSSWREEKIDSEGRTGIEALTG